MENIKTVNDLRGTVWKIADDADVEYASYSTNCLKVDSSVPIGESYIKLVSSEYNLDIAKSSHVAGTDEENTLITFEWYDSGIAVADNWYFIGVIRGSTLYFSPNLPENYLIDGGTFLIWLKQYGTLIDTIKPTDTVKPTLSSLFKDITNALREKQGTTEPIKHLDIAGKIRNLSVSNGVEINGNLITCECFEPITAGDFVEYVKEVCVKLETTAYTSYHSSVILDDNKAFIAYRYGSSKYLYGMIVEITDTTITYTTTQLDANSYSCTTIPSAVLLEPNKVFIAHTYTGYLLYGTIVEINGNEMIATTTQLNGESNICYEQPSAVRLDNNKVFITHIYGSSMSKLYGTIVEINGTEMIATTTQLDSTGGYNKTPHAILLENNKVFLAIYLRGNWTHELHGAIVEIQGNEMLIIKDTYIQLISVEQTPNALLLEPNKVLITVRGYSSDYNIYAEIVEIDSSGEMTYTKTQITNDNITSYGSVYPKAIKLDNNQVFIVHNRDTNNRYLYGTIIKINGTNIEVVSSKKLNNTSNSGGYSGTESNLEALLFGNKVFITHPYNSSYYLSGTIHHPFGVTPMTTTINGVANTSGNAGEEIQVYIPKEVN